METRLFRASSILRAAIVGAALALSAARFAPAAAAQEPAEVPPAAAQIDEAEPPVSARGAFVRSLLVPGWGQAYVGAPGRGAIYFAMEAGSAWMVYKTYQQLEEARDAQAWLQEAGRLPADEKLDLVEAREEQLEDWLAISIFLLLFSGADAYVTAQLADFDEHIGVQAGTGGGARLEVRLPVGAPRR